MKPKLYLASLSLVFIALCVIIMGYYSYNKHTQPINTSQRFSQLELLTNGRLGIYVINTANNDVIKYRADERFAFCSTGKVITVASLLKKSENNLNLLNESIKYLQKDVDNSTYAPITKNHISTGLSLNQLAKAAIEYSDNTAINLIIQSLGGPKAVTSYARTLNDTKFRLDRDEPSLNTALPGDKRDTTTPKAMAQSLQQLLVGNALESFQRNELLMWLNNNTTGDKRIRAGVPNTWQVGDKTGTGDYGSTSDIGIIVAPKCKPIIVAIYFTRRDKNAPARDDIIASATQIIVKHLVSSDDCLKATFKSN